jgi:hypothetical protein
VEGLHDRDGDHLQGLPNETQGQLLREYTVGLGACRVNTAQCAGLHMPSARCRSADVLGADIADGEVVLDSEGLFFRPWFFARRPVVHRGGEMASVAGEF